jgi:hypothetical protein
MSFLLYPYLVLTMQSYDRLGSYASLSGETL